MKVQTLGETKRNEILKKLTETLRNREEIIFAYVHGSFLTGSFRDVDVAVYLEDNKDIKDVFYELQLEVELEKILGLPADTRILNSAPLSFRFSVIQGLLLFSKDERTRTDFEVSTISEYHDFAYFRRRYRREALGI
jgi:hypothetical protein